MNKQILAIRTQTAVQHILAEARTAAVRFGLQEEADALAAVPGKDKDVAMMLRLEGIGRIWAKMNAATSPAAEIPTPSGLAAQHTVAELRDIIAEADAAQLDRLEKAESEEEGGKGRTTVFQAIEKRRAHLLDELPNEAPEDGPDPDAE
jgi:hypothetical protein